MARKEYKVGDWLCTFGKVTYVDDMRVTLQIGGSEVNVLKAEVWNPDEKVSRGTPESESKP